MSGVGPLGAKPATAVLIDLMTGHWLSRSVHEVVALGVPEVLAEGPRDIDEIAAKVGADARALYRVMRALASVGLFTESEPRRFGTTTIGALLRGDVPGSMRPLAMGIGSGWSAWGDLGYSLRTGKASFEHVHGVPYFGYLDQHPEERKRFDHAMSAIVAATSAAVVAGYDFTPFSRVVDVGGGHGTLVASVLKASPKTKGVVFDTPSVIEGARARMASEGLSDRCECVAGDFFAEVPAGGDVYVLTSILHDWEDEEAKKILQSCRKAMAPGTRLLVIEHLVPPGDAPSGAKLLDLNMLVMLGGRERTLDEYKALLGPTGFQVERVVPIRSTPVIVECTTS